MLPSGATSADACLPCAAGSYCPNPAMTVPVTPCATSHFCVAGSGTDQPPAGICNPGHYCDGGEQQIALVLFL